MILIENISSPVTFSINNKIFDEIGDELNSFLGKHKKIYLEANPSYGKTYHFAQLGNDIKNGKSTYKRLIFCTPRLIIQEQIANDNLKVDFKLNGDSKLSELTDDCKVITTTFNSLHLIANQITEDDLIVVDEAHELLRNFNNNYAKTTNPYYHKTLQVLHNSSFSLVLMSGTPTYNFHELLGLKHLKIVKNNETKVAINIDFTELRPKELAFRFCEKYSKQYATDKLNVIYIKNVKDCIDIAHYLNEKGFNTRAITSKTKEEKVYLNIAKTSIVPSTIQFIITTNVLSVGTNILNTNIGGVVMLNEYDPIEIKQFSKRFREMGSLKIDLVNRFPKTKGISEEKIHNIQAVNKKITFNQIAAQRTLLKSISNEELLTFKEMSFEKNDFSSPNYIINQAIEKYLTNESYLNELKVSANNTPEKLIRSLNEYNDIEASISEVNKSLFKDHNETITEEARALFKEKISFIIDDFIVNKTQYILGSFLLLSHKDFEKEEKFKEYLNEHLDFSQLQELENKVVKKLIQTQLFQTHIIEPILEFIPYFYNLDICLKFIQQVKPEHRRKHILSLHTNNLIRQYCDIKQHNTSFTLTYKRNSEIFQDAKHKDKLLLDIIKIAFEYLIHAKVLHVHDFRKYLADNKYFLALLSQADKNIFPYNMLSNNKLNTSFLLGLVNGILVFNPNKSIHKDKSDKLKKAFIFEKDISKHQGQPLFRNEINIRKNSDSKDITKIELTKIFSSSSIINSSL
jgi:hypothetical protein